MRFGLDSGIPSFPREFSVRMVYFFLNNGLACDAKEAA